MDPSWTECAYCKAEGPVGQSGDAAPRSARRETVVESAAPNRSARPESPQDRERTRAETEMESQTEPRSQRRKTEFYAPPPSVPSGRGFTVPEGGKTPAVAGRKIVGVLITYTWQSEGQIFPVREGRNLIGRDAGKCDIAIPEDDTLSAVNSHITFRKNFLIGDNVSMSGTYVNGEPVEEQFKPLANYATIRTGATTWTFVAIEGASPSTPRT